MDRSRAHRQQQHRACDPCRKSPLFTRSQCVFSPWRITQFTLQTHTGQRKIKCSRGHPCRRCSRLALHCEYSRVKPMGRPRQPRDMGISPPTSSGPSLNPSSAQESLSIVYGLAMEAPERPVDLIAPAAHHTPGLSSIDLAVGASWSDLMQLGESGWLEHCNLGNFSNSSPQETQCMNGQVNGATHSSDQRQALCTCMELVHEHLSALEAAVAKLQSIKILRKSTGVAEKVLGCPVCFDINRRPSDVSGNVLLFSSLMLSITTCYGNIFRNEEQTAAESIRSTSPIRLFLGHDLDQSCLVDFSFGGRDYRNLLKRAFSSELDRLSLICHSFSARQRRLHENGHEQCCTGQPCKRLDATGRVVHPADACPRAMGSMPSFSCFWSATHVQSEIEKIQRSLSLDP